VLFIKFDAVALKIFIFAWHSAHLALSLQVKYQDSYPAMKFISWNVNGLRAVAGKGFDEIFKALDADFFCLQETKMQAGQLDLEFEGYRSYWNYAEKKGYSGTAIYSRHEPLNVTYGMGIEEHDNEGRVITLEMPDFFLVTCYTPNSQDGLRRLDYRMTWEDAFRAYLLELDKKKPVIVCGDLNVAHQEIDLKNPKTNRKNAGFTDEEREKMTVLLGSGFTDTWRFFNPDVTDVYSWWSYRFKAREKNAGWRIDYFLVSNRLQDRLTDAKIHTEIYGSDHCPVEVDIRL
jgi:exodeoxyribonuclease-3